MLENNKFLMKVINKKTFRIMKNIINSTKYLYNLI